MKRGRTSRAGAVLTALLALLMCGALAGTAQAATTQDPFDGTNFQAGDGNQIDEGGHVDWESIATIADHELESVVDTDDNIRGGFTGGSKETEPGAWELTSIGSPPKDNILNGWATTGENDVGDTILYLAFRRESPNGNTFLTFELNQRTELWDNDGDASTPTVPCREDGDILISYEVEPGGTTEPDPVTIKLYTWIEDTEDPDTGCSVTGHFDPADGIVLNDPTDANPDAQAAINEDGDIENFLDTNGDGVFDDTDIQTFGEGTFGEAAINITAIFDAEGVPCFDFGQIQMHSRASSSIDSELKDFAGPLGIPVATCTASGIKFEDLNGDGAWQEGEGGLEGWIIWADYNNDGILDNDMNDTLDADEEPFAITDENGAYTIDGLTQEYTLREMPGDGVDGTWTCSYPSEGETGDGPSGPAPDPSDGHTGLPTPDEGTQQDCGWGPIDPNDEENAVRDFGNYEQADITLVKQIDSIDPDDPGLFDLLVGDETLADDVGDNGSGTGFFNPGTYDISELAGTDTSLDDYTTSIHCELNGDDLGDDVDDTARGDLVLQSGDSLTCTFTNTRKTGKLTVVKQIESALPNDDGLFDLLIGGETVVTDGGDGASATRTLVTGDYDISELAGTGTSLADYNSKVECDNEQGNDPGTSLDDVHVTDGSDITCTFTNTRKTGELTVQKVIDPADDGGLFDLKVGDDVIVENASNGDGDTITVPAGSYDVSEVAGDNTSLGDYASSVECVDGETTVVEETLATAVEDVPVADGSHVVCTFTNTRNPGKITVKKVVVSDDPDESGSFNLQVDDTIVATGGDGTEGSTQVAPGTYDVSETGDETDLDHYSTTIECVDGEEIVVEETAATSVPVDVDSNDDIVCTITNTALTTPGINVVKEIRNVTLGGSFVHVPPAAPIDAYVGDTLEYRFTVTNTGNVALAVVIGDPRCNAGTITAPTGNTDGDNPPLLDVNETWVYTCRHLVTASDPDPLPNTVTATGTIPDTDRSVSDQDSASADIFHPAIDIEKTGPATATAGDVLNYTLTVKNTGDIPFASDKVVVGDPNCDDQPTLTSKNGDTTPNSLDPGTDTWTYTCSHLTTASESSYTNTATVTGTDRNGRKATDSDSVVTAIAGQLPEVPGTARLRGPSGCVRGPFKATVRGTRIARVTFFLDGKRFKRINATSGQTKFQVSINPRGRGFGVHRVTARVQFVSEANTSNRTLRLSFQRCKKQVVKPRFTG